MRGTCARCSELPQMLQLSESDSLACKGCCTMGELMLTQLLTKDQIDAHLEKLDQKIKELETNDISDVIEEPKRIQNHPGFHTNESETIDILDIINEPKRIQDPPRIQTSELETSPISEIMDEPKRIHDPPGVQTKDLETSRVSDIMDEPKRIQDPPRIYEKTHSENSRLYQAGEFIVSAIAIILIIFAVIFTALISATLWEIIQQFGFRQYVSVAILAAILLGSGYFLGYARRE